MAGPARPHVRARLSLAGKILEVIGKEPLYYTDIAERFSAYDFHTVARALGHLHATEKLWQDPRGRMCVRGSDFAAKPPPGGELRAPSSSGAASS